MRKPFFAAFFAVLMSCGGGGSDEQPFIDDPRPGKRSDIATVADPDTGRLVVFGGDDGPIVAQIPMPNFVADTWVLDPVTGWREVAGAGPSARGRYAVAGNGNGAALFFGGRFRAASSGDYTLYNDLWAFDFSTETWSQLSSGAAPAPSPRYFATSAVDSETGDLVVYGGGTNTSALSLQPNDEVWRWNGESWSPVTTTGTAPSSRLFMAYTHDGQRNRLVVYGGQIGDFVSPALGDLYALDLASGTWTQLHDGSGTAPSGRFSAMLSYDAQSDRYVLFGGHADPGVTNDVWFFDPQAGTWSAATGGDSFTGGGLGCAGNNAEIPDSYVTQDLAAPERRSGGAFALVDGSIMLFGGESDCSDHLDDVWRFDVATSAWSELSTARSGESCARRGDDCACLCL